MTKNDLAKQLSIERKITKKKAYEVVRVFFDSMTDAMINQEGIEVRGFGSFVVKKYKPYTGRNPKTGGSIQVPAKKMPFFKVGKDLREKINNKKV